jgi:hypothetical protein
MVAHHDETNGVQAAASAIAAQDPSIPLDIRGEIEIKGKGTMVRLLHQLHSVTFRFRLHR